MTEKKTKSATEAKESVPKAKNTRAKRSKKQASPVEVRKQVSEIVKEKAVQLAEAVIGKSEEAVPGDLQLATVKYMFEVAAIYPPQADQESETDEEDSLAKTLLHRLNIPDKPVRRDEDEEEEVEGSSVKTLPEPAQEKSESEDSGTAESAGASREPESV